MDDPSFHRRVLDSIGKLSVAEIEAMAGIAHSACDEDDRPDAPTRQLINVDGRWCVPLTEDEVDALCSANSEPTVHVSWWGSRRPQLMVSATPEVAAVLDDPEANARLRKSAEYMAEMDRLCDSGPRYEGERLKPGPNVLAEYDSLALRVARRDSSSGQ